MSCTLYGLTDWEVGKDKEGHRDFLAKWLVKVDSVLEGPATVLNCPGAPAVGSYWNIGLDADAGAFCHPDWKASAVLSREPGLWWILETPFSTRPIKRCQDSSIENPLAEPPKLSGSFVKYMKQITKDRFGNILKSVSHEPLRGPIVEFEDNKPTVRIEMNVGSNPLSTFATMIDMVNDAALWGLNARMVKLSNVTWARNIYGTCNFYYTVTYEFDIDFKTFDRKAPSVGRKVLAPGGDKANPKDFIVYKDRNEENSECYHDVDGNAAVNEAAIKLIDIEYYEQGNLLALGIPASL